MSLKLNRKNFPNYIYYSFTLFIIASLYFGNIFRAPLPSENKKIENHTLLNIAEFNLIDKILLKNKNGEFVFEKTNKNEISPWELISPRPIIASTNFFDKLNFLFKTAKIKKIYPDDKINYSNFSLEKPLATLNIHFTNQTNQTISLGLNNTIDKSIYLKFSNRKGIYHLESPEINFENLTLIQLIESQIFSFDLNNINQFTIYKGKKETQPIFEISKIENTWNDKNKNEIDSKILENLFQDLSTLKSTFILDKQSEGQKRIVQNLKKASEFIINIRDNKNNIAEYTISPLFKDFPDINLKNESYFLISNSSNSTAYIVSKEFFSLFNIKTDAFIKKN